MENTRNISGGMRVAPRSFPGGMGPRRARSAAPASVCRPAGQTGEPAPIWMAVLQATECQAVANGEDHAVEWDFAAGRAIYTNQSAGIEEIQPLGVTLRRGHTLAVTWMPGETAYTLEIYRQGSHYAA